MKSNSLSLIGLALLAGCSQSEKAETAQEIVAEVEPDSAANSAPENKFGFAEAVETKPDPFGANAPDARSNIVSTYSVQSEPAVAVPTVAPAAQQQIAYSYGYGFRISGGKMAELQRRHAASCAALKAKCRILRQSQASSDGDSYGEMKLEVAAAEAGAFEKALTEPAEELGGELISSVRDGEDLSENITDTEAKLQSRLVLREKLTDILRKNTGSVDELIKAEQAVADVNEEIDATRSKLEQFRGRIRYSDVRIEYQPNFGESQLGFARPVKSAVGAIGTTLGTTVAVLIYLLTALIPVTLAILALRWLLHRFNLRIRFWRKDAKSSGAPS